MSRWSLSSFRAEVLVAGVALVIAAAWLSVVPFLSELPVYFEQARSLANGQRLPADNFSPIGYSLLLAPFVAVAGTDGVAMLHVASYGLAALLALRVLRDNEVAGPMVLLGVAAFLLHPYLLLNLNRVNDNAINVLLFLLLFVYLLRPGGSGWTLLVAVGLALGLLCAIRPNAFVFLLLPFAKVLLTMPRPRVWHEPLVILAVALAVLSLMSLVGTGAPFFFPGNGPYNLFAGNNPFSAEFLQRQFNAEYSIDPALAHYGLAGLDRYDVEGEVYLGLVVRFAVEQPVDFLHLLALKLRIFFGPDLSHAGTLGEVLVQSLLALICPLWLVSYLVSRRRLPSWRNHLTLLLVLLFVTPFLLSNADPRFRLPLELVLLLDALMRLDRMTSPGRTTEGKPA